jgi:hypothetical protein
MVPNPRATAGADSLRPLNQPRPITILADPGGYPAALVDGHHPRLVRVQDTWRIDDEWWRDPIARSYYHVVMLDDGTLRTIYHDLVDGRWYEQAY